MGSYSCADHLLPFVTQADLDQAMDILRLITRSLNIKTGRLYRGIIYGGFMVTAEGVKLIEINARFGDPEAMNVLSLLETDFLAICWSIAQSNKHGWLDQLGIKFQHLNTVCKYVVPLNYGIPKDQWVKTNSDLIQIGDLGKASLYYSSVFSDATGCHMTSSRAVAVLGVSSELAEAEKIAEQATRAITGKVAHRMDIGTAGLIARRMWHMKELRRAQSAKSMDKIMKFPV
jgi:phosphoribosylamine--glycine ligase